MNEIVDIATEDVVIGSLILNPSEYNIIAQFIPEAGVFSQAKAKALWKKVAKMIKKGAMVDTLTVIASITTDEESQGITRGYVIDCTSNACALGMTEVYAQKIYEKYLLRKIANESQNIQSGVINHGEDVYELITSAHTLMGELLRVRPGEQFSISKVLDDTAQTMKNGRNRMIKTGYRKIDDFAGGLTRGEVSIVGG